MSEKKMTDAEIEEARKTTKIIMGAAFVKPELEKEHYGLYRDLIVERTGEFGEPVRDTMETPMGPLLVFRVARQGDVVHMRTIDPTTMQEIKLTKVWDPREE